MILIHACPAREWYVNNFIIPSLIAQGITDIHVWMDTDGHGNLASCIDSFAWCSQLEGETWHLQDDVVVCRDFAQRISSAPSGVVCGFCVDIYENEDCTDGTTISRFMWQSSFPCIKIPNEVAGEFVEWFINEAQHRSDLREYVQSGKKDDTLFHIFMLERHFNMKVTNLSPHLVDHVDWLVGGSTINQWREHIVRSSDFDDENLIEELKEKIASYKDSLF